MKVKFTNLSDQCVETDHLKIGDTYECEKISVFGSAYIKNSKGEPDILFDGEFEVVEE